ncbi:MAG: hypothetical protein ACLP5V_12680 [Candidatus Bathyarchaeia archaeon]
MDDTSGRYRQRSIRIPSIYAAHVQIIASEDGWQFSDLLRSLIVLGATRTWGSLSEEENRDRFMDLAVLGAVSRALYSDFSKRPSKRPYASPRSQDTEVVTLFFPAGYAEMVQTYAATKRMSQNNACVRFLETGLLAYMEAQAIMLQTVQSVRNHSEQPPSKSS